MNDMVQKNESDPDDIALADQIDLTCDEFEQAWLNGQTPRIEDFLGKCDDSAHERFFVELLLVDREFRIRQGEGATREEYRQRFPEYSSVIDALEFATIDDRISTRSAGLAILNRPGRKLAHFELIEELGIGASGAVWKARDTRLQRLVAIKIPHQGIMTKAEQERFMREGQTCAQLRHPNIVAVYEVGNENGQTFIAAELIDGPNLRDSLRNRRPRFNQAAELAAQLADALHHSHEQGIIHRDLKPANVLIDRDGRPLITDFGLAKWTASRAQFTVEGNVLGTPAYMSPEQARGESSRVDGRSDVYGLGALLYELLTERAPFEGDVASIVHQVIHVAPKPPRRINPAIPKDLETICLKAMDKEPSRRYFSAQEMAVDLRRFARGESILARRAGPVERSWRWVRRHPSIAAAVFLLVAVIATASAMISSLSEQNYRLQGYRPVLVESNPHGARVAFVPIDKRTGEPDPRPAGIVRPQGTTPTSTLLKPGDYFVEAVVPGEGDAVDIAEEYISVPAQGGTSDRVRRWNRLNGYDEEQLKISLAIHKSKEVITSMVAVPIADELRHKNPLLPKLLYIDATETRPEDVEKQQQGTSKTDSAKQNTKAFSFEDARALLMNSGRRLPSAAEYEAIVQSVKTAQIDHSANRHRTQIDDLFDDHPEWTTTKYHFPGAGASPQALTQLEDMYVLQGYGDANKVPDLRRTPDGKLIAPPDAMSPLIGFRGVRSGAPRFVTP